MDPRDLARLHTFCGYVPCSTHRQQCMTCRWMRCFRLGYIKAMLNPHSHVLSTDTSTVNVPLLQFYPVKVGLVVLSKGDHLSDVAGLEADVERPLEELLARRFSSVSRPANCTAQLNTDISRCYSTVPRCKSQPSCTRVSVPAGMPSKSADSEADSCCIHPNRCRFVRN